MSIKAGIMKVAVHQPQVVSNFSILIPGVLQSPVRCHTASLPFDQRDSYSISVTGEKINLPKKSNASGTWQCTIYESSLMDMGVTIDALRSMEITETRGFISKLNLHDIYIMIFNNQSVPTFAKVLRYAWLQSVTASNLSSEGAATAMEYTLTFQYSFCDRLI